MLGMLKICNLNGAFLPEVLYLMLQLILRPFCYLLAHLKPDLEGIRHYHI